MRPACRGQAGPTPNSEIKASEVMIVDITRTNRPTCITNVHNQSLRTMIDSGAECSIINSQMLSRIPPEYYQKVKGTPIRMKSATGDIIPCDSSYLIRMKIGNASFTQKVNAVDGLKYTLLLGADFLTTQRVILDCANRTVTLRGEVAPPHPV